MSNTDRMYGMIAQNDGTGESFRAMGTLPGCLTFARRCHNRLGMDAKVYRESNGGEVWQAEWHRGQSFTFIHGKQVAR